MLTGDSRLVTECEDLQELLDALDIDGVEDLEDLLMLMLRRPVGVDYREDEEFGNSIEVIVYGDAGALGTELEFPLTMGEIARSALTEETAENVGPWSQGPESPDCGRELRSMDSDELTRAFGRALGQLRVMKLLGN